MAKKKKKAPRKFTIPLAPTLGLIAGLAGPAHTALSGDYEGAIREATENYTGYNITRGEWMPLSLMKGLAPLIIGAMVHKFVGGAPLNLNKTLAAAGVPLIRI